MTLRQAAREVCGGPEVAPPPHRENNTRMAQRLLVVFLFGAIGCSADPVGLVYDPCFDGADCEALADACFSVTNPANGITDNFCSVGCNSDRDCPFDARGDVGACLSVEGGLQICYERCFDDLDCPSGFGCFDTTVADPICLPL